MYAGNVASKFVNILTYSIILFFYYKWLKPMNF